MRSRRRRLGLLVLAVMGVAAALVAAGPAPGIEPGDNLPDLVADPPDGAHLHLYVDSSGTRLLLRFDGYVHNQGPGPLEIWGTGPTSLEMSNTFQRIFKTSGASRDDATKSPWLIYETADGHNHWHFRAAASYLLYDFTKTAVVAPAQKVGFCLVDSQHVNLGVGPSGAVYQAATFCGQNQPTASQVMMGISAGWRDKYDAGLAFQWVDVSDVQPGRYWLASRADPDDTVIEANESNPIAYATASTTIPGYVAKPFFVSTSASQATSFLLSADGYGTTNGTLRYRIVSGPAHGTLSQTVGVPLTNPAITYTPTPGYNGADSFAYVAYDSSSTFPRSPAPAAVSIAVGTVTPTVQISGAPAAMTAGTSVQLSATVTGDPPTVTWSVVSAGGGTVSSSGLYTAPSQPPGSGSATIRAASARASAQVTIAIQPTQPPAPAPTTPPAAPPSPAPQPTTTPPPATDPSSPSTNDPAKTKVAAKIDLLRAPVLARRKRSILISTESGKAGTIEITALKGSSALGRCVTRTPAGRELTCRVMLEPGAPLKGVRVLLRLRSKGELLAYRRATFSRATSYYLGAGLQCWIGPGAANPAAVG